MGKSVRGIIIAELPNKEYLCRISEDDQENPGQVVCVHKNDLMDFYIVQEVSVYIPVSGKIFEGSITEKLPGNVYLCKISEKDPESPGLLIRVHRKDLNEMVVLSKV